MDEIAGGDLVRSGLHRSSKIEQSSPDARKLSRSAAGPLHRELFYQDTWTPRSARHGEERSDEMLFHGGSDRRAEPGSTIIAAALSKMRS
jgi:hypothetical protein